MPDKLDPEEVAGERVERDENGDLLPDPRTITWKGEERVVEVVPLTIGHIQRYERTSGGDYDEMDMEAIFTIVQNHYADPDFSDWTLEEFEALKAARAVELMEAFNMGDLAEQGNR